MTMSRSWILTLIPFFMYVIASGWVLVTGMELTAQQIEVLNGMLYTLITTGSIGGAIGVASRFGNNKPKPS